MYIRSPLVKQAGVWYSPQRGRHPITPGLQSRASQENRWQGAQDENEALMRLNCHRHYARLRDGPQGARNTRFASGMHFDARGRFWSTCCYNLRVLRVLDHTLRTMGAR